MDYWESGCKNLPGKSVKCFINEIVYCSLRNPKDKTPPKILYSYKYNNSHFLVIMEAQYSTLRVVKGDSVRMSRGEMFYVQSGARANVLVLL